MSFYQYLSQDKNENFLDHIAPIPKELLSDIEEPLVTSQLLSLEEITLWHDRANQSTRSLGHYNDREQLLCVVTGELKITIISPFERSLLYPGGGDHMPLSFSPVDFFRPNNEFHPHFKTATPFDINLADGDCLYIPAYWWQMSESSPEQQTIAISFWYTVGSTWLKLLF